MLGTFGWKNKRRTKNKKYDEKNEDIISNFKDFVCRPPHVYSVLFSTVHLAAYIWTGVERLPILAGWRKRLVWATMFTNPNQMKWRYDQLKRLAVVAERTFRRFLLLKCIFGPFWVLFFNYGFRMSKMENGTNPQGVHFCGISYK